MLLIISNKTKDMGTVIKEGYLIKQGTVVKNYFRVYVRLTKTVLYYYDTPSVRPLPSSILLFIFH